METSYYSYIRAILDTGNITRAAKSLFISQPALSQAINRLETQLGTKILDRSKNPIRLTLAGKKYMAASEKINAITTNLMNEISEITDEYQGELRLGISMQRGIQLLPSVIPLFSARFPHVTIELIEEGSSTLEKMLHDGACDLALITTEPRYTDLHYELLESEEVVLVAAYDTTFAKQHKAGSVIPISAAASELFVSLCQGHSVRTIQDELFARNRFDPSILLETDNLEAAKRLVAEGAALMLCPSVYITQSPEICDKVKCFRIQNMGYKRHFYFSYRKDMTLTRFMIEFRDIVKEHLATQARRTCDGSASHLPLGHT